MEAHGTPAKEPPAWKLNYKIGSGGFGAVFLEKVQTRQMESPALWAVKRISRALPNFPAQRYIAEIKNLQTLSAHEWCVKFNNWYEDAHYVYIAMEYVPLGDMTKTFADGYRWNERDTKVVIEQLLHGLTAMHKEGITHRDLKPANIFLCLPEDRTYVVRVKIGDFGASKCVSLLNPSTSLRTTTGTQGYMAPEMHDTSISKTNKVDIWSLGCILYRMVAGRLLFTDPTQLLRYTMTASSPPPVVKTVGFSAPCVDFLYNALQPSPEDRPSAEGCQKMAWITSNAPGSDYSIGRDLYTRLLRINLAAPDIDSLSDVITHRAAGDRGVIFEEPRDKTPEPTSEGMEFYGYLGVNNVSRNSPFFPEGPIFGEPRGGTPEPAPEEMEVYGVLVREPPAWKLGYEIGSGSFGTVFLEKVQARGMGSPELWAVKVISLALPNFPAERYRQEIWNLKTLLDHEWFVKFNASYQDNHYVYIAMEYIPIGDMTKTFVGGYRWNESDTKVVIEQLFCGLAIMHKEGITHRDLKPENIFLYFPEHGAQVLRVKIGGFNLSKLIPSDSTTFLKTSAGALGYMAPEMDDTSVKTNRVDVWSLGCILYRMVAGSSLFNNRSEVFRYSLTRSPPLPAVEKIGLSVACVDFLREVLKPEPMDRPSAEDCLKKAWITSKGPGLEYSVGRVLYKMLSQIQLAAPDIDSFSDAVAKRAADNAPTRSLSTVATPATDSSASSIRSARSFDSTRTLESVRPG